MQGELFFSLYYFFAGLFLFIIIIIIFPLYLCPFLLLPSVPGAGRNWGMGEGGEWAFPEGQGVEESCRWAISIVVGLFSF